MSEDQEKDLGFEPEEIGYWSEIKLDILRKYATQYSRILTADKRFRHIYIDAFSGAGLHKSKRDGGLVEGSPQIALSIEPPFDHYYFIDLNKKKTEFLGRSIGNRNDVTIEEGDCNVILREKIFPEVRYADFKRGLCILDPYGLHLDWDIVREAGEMKSLEIFLNFSIMDFNMNMSRENPEKIKNSQIERMNKVWGDDTWYDIVYEQDDPDLFKHDRERRILAAPKKLAAEFRNRLLKIAKFRYVSQPLPMRNNSGGIIYYLYFASQNKVGDKIMKYLFENYSNRNIK